ncbi:hypothetical protein OJF2_65250 [Aquisphaera giovannonii]|uniref:Helix-turn-helix domain protein n=1 Tax=Aquisphaera giovannonii TaxID=406548 RepID=A0A5B9WDH1_9BACT|nr:helix-turn-helix domain-containing protein [Aquisphaera giovannonii]QEH37930.1 hypothetical protein OJF2_65250 [Aquisphaera giovannonii]
MSITAPASASTGPGHGDRGRPATLSRYVSIAAASRIVGLSEKAIRTLIRSGELPAHVLPCQTRQRVDVFELNDVVTRSIRPARAE